MLVAAGVAALTLLPNKMREDQAELDGDSYATDGGSEPAALAPQAIPVAVAVDSSAITATPPVQQGWFH